MRKFSKTTEETIRRLLVDLAQGRFAEVAADGRIGRIGRLTMDELQRAIADYAEYCD